MYHFFRGKYRVIEKLLESNGFSVFFIQIIIFCVCYFILSSVRFVYTIIYKVFSFKNTYFAIFIRVLKALVFLNFVYNPMRAASTGSTPTTLHILMYNLFRNIQVSLFRYKKELNVTFNMTPNMPDE